MSGKIDISLIIPCLNEAPVLDQVLSEAQIGLQTVKNKYKLTSEIIVVDNGSTDGSDLIVRKNKQVKLVRQPIRGYGATYQKGFRAARGQIFILADSDGTYDLTRLVPFIAAIKANSDLVLGSRFMRPMEPGAMPFFNRYLGNPLLTAVLNLTYHTRISDAHTGMRALTAESARLINLQSHGMEFASEMIVKAVYHKLTIGEIPIIYRRRVGRSKLVPISDAWRHLKFLLIYSPTYAFIMPGALLFALGIGLTVWLTPGAQFFWGRTIDIHTLASALLIANVGLHISFLGLFARAYTKKNLGLPSGPLATYLLKHLSVERLLVLGGAILILGLTVMGNIVGPWAASGFGQLAKIREVIVAVGLSTMGLQIIFSAFLYGLITE